MEKQYFVTADIHGYYTEMLAVLDKQGFDKNDPNHILIILGDLFDRGKEAKALEQFAVSMMKQNRLIFIRGNHEDLMLSMIKDWPYEQGVVLNGWSHHNHNGTFDTALQLTGMSWADVRNDPATFIDKLKATDYISYLIPNSVNYYETEKYIFVHGWIPCTVLHNGTQNPTYFYNEDWRNAPESEWEKARWANGMHEAITCKIIEPYKTIVCGHWNASYGHYHYGNASAEFRPSAVHTPFFHDGIIALDAATPSSGFVNCIVFKE